MLHGVQHSRFGSGTRLVRMPLIAVETRDGDARLLERIHVADGRALGKPLIWFQPATRGASESAEGVLVADAGDGRWGAARAGELAKSGYFGLIAVAAHEASQSVVLAAYRAGAHLWVPLPPDPLVFPVQVECLIRRLAGDLAAEEIDVQVGPEDRVVRLDGTPIRLTPQGHRLLLFLLQRRGAWISGEVIANELTPPEARADAERVRSWVLRLRSALGELAWILESREGWGFRLNLRKDSSAARRLRPHGRYRHRPQ